MATPSCSSRAGSEQLVSAAAFFAFAAPRRGLCVIRSPSPPRAGSTVAHRDGAPSCSPLGIRWPRSPFSRPTDRHRVVFAAVTRVRHAPVGPSERSATPPRRRVARTVGETMSRERTTTTTDRHLRPRQQSLRRARAASRTPPSQHPEHAIAPTCDIDVAPPAGARRRPRHDSCPEPGADVGDAAPDRGPLLWAAARQMAAIAPTSRRSTIRIGACGVSARSLADQRQRRDCRRTPPGVDRGLAPGRGGRRGHPDSRDLPIESMRIR
jgi:hypothetical protein